VQGTEKTPNGVWRHLLKEVNLSLMEIALKLGEIAPVGFNGIASEAAFNPEMIEVPLNQGVRFHFGDDSQSFS
jgi:hypothetical protein